MKWHACLTGPSASGGQQQLHDGHSGSRGRGAGPLRLRHPPLPRGGHRGGRHCPPCPSGGP